MNKKFDNSLIQLERAENTIPLGSQTFSKSRTQYPVGISPLFIERGKGAYTWDIDGNKYVDLINALASVTLGYSDRNQNQAVRKQLRKGVNFSLPAILESEVSELIVRMVPCAEKVRFGKNGSDATAAAIRLARAYTGREKIAACGYHGWQDWYIGATSRNKGVPKSTSDLINLFEYNNISSLERILESSENQFAAVILEPMNSEWPKDNFLERVKLLAKKNGAVLIFDETITGFRFARGGAQELFQVIPDLATFGKGIANGFPLSAVVGKSEIMNEMEEIFFSGTFGGELLSLAAAKYVLELHLEQDIPSKLQNIGKNIQDGLNEITHDLGINKTLSLSGHPSWQFLNWNIQTNLSQSEVRTLFMQEMFQNGVLMLGTHNITTAIKNKEINHILSGYEKTLKIILKALERGTVEGLLKVRPLEPLFRVR